MKYSKFKEFCNFVIGSHIKYIRNLLNITYKGTKCL